MKAEYKRDLQHNYLIFEVFQDAAEDDYQFRMAEQNEIPGLLPFHSARTDGVLYLHYEITSKQPLDSLYERKTMKYEDILFLLTGLRDALESAQRYLLNSSQLVFDPQYIYIEPERRTVELCYLPGEEERAQITALAEFVLKRLDHREPRAVTLGYGFYQRAAEENFSLCRMLKEVLSAQQLKESPVFQRSDAQKEELQAEPVQGGYLSNRSSPAENTGERGGRAEGYDEYRRRQSGEPAPPGEGLSLSPELRMEYGVTRCERRRKERTWTDRLFEAIHPAVLISGLALIAALEIVFYLGWLTITEAGGLFFLLISAEVLANHIWKSFRDKGKRSEAPWAQPEDDGAYRMLQEEMYEKPEERTVIEETRCLMPDSLQETLCLVCVRTGPEGREWPEIPVGETPVCVGKVRGECDVLLDSPTVSRRHARLECQEGSYYVKDLNSRNGTFCNGKRLMPQERYEFRKGDQIAFAEIEYRAILRAGRNVAER